MVKFQVEVGSRVIKCSNRDEARKHKRDLKAAGKSPKIIRIEYATQSRKEVR